MKEITRYQCEHCNKHFASAKYANNHEFKCWANPSIRACRSCLHQENNFVVVGEPNIVRQDGWKCVIGYGDGHNVRNCPKWQSWMEFGG